MKKIVSIILSIFLLLVLISTVILADAKEETVVFSRAEGFPQRDPYQGAAANQVIDRLIYDRLVELMPDGSIAPGLAESWELSENEKEVTFHLHKGIKFHNGEPFTAEAVKVTLERLRDDTSLKHGRKLGPDQIEKVEIIDDYTCVLYLKAPYGPLFNILGAFDSILPPKAFAEQGVALFDHPIGTGPYKFVEYVQDVSLTVEANKDYWNEEFYPRVDKIIYKPIMEPSTQIAALLTGEVDILDMVHPDQAAVLEADPNITVIREPSWDAWFFEFNSRHPILNDIRVRTAIDLATDREGLVEVMGGGAPCYTWGWQGQVGYTPDIRSEYDPERARKILKQTGYSAEELTFKFNVPEGWFPKLKEVAVVLQSMMADVGISFKVNVMEGGAFREARAASDYDIFVTGGALPDPAIGMIPLVVKDAYGSGFVNETLNQLIYAGSNTLDNDMRQFFYEQAFQIMFAQKAPQLVFFQMETIYAFRNRITDFPFVRHKVVHLRSVDTTDNPGPVK